MYATSNNATYGRSSPADGHGQGVGGSRPGSGRDELNNNANYHPNYYNQNAGIGTRARGRSQTLGGTMGGPGAVQYGDSMRTTAQQAYRRDQTAAGRFNAVVGQNSSDRERAAGAAVAQQNTSLKPSYIVPPTSSEAHGRTAGARVTDRGSNAEYGRALYSANSAPSGSGSAAIANNFHKLQQQAHQQSAVIRAQNAMHNHRRNPLW